MRRPTNPRLTLRSARRGNDEEENCCELYRSMMNRCRTTMRFSRKYYNLWNETRIGGGFNNLEGINHIMGEGAVRRGSCLVITLAIEMIHCLFILIYRYFLLLIEMMHCLFILLFNRLFLMSSLPIYLVFQYSYSFQNKKNLNLS
jgi:hypothetical protein